METGCPSEHHPNQAGSGDSSWVSDIVFALTALVREGKGKSTVQGQAIPQSRRSKQAGPPELLQRRATLVNIVIYGYTFDRQRFRCLVQQDSDGQIDETKAWLNWIYGGVVGSMLDSVKLAACSKHSCTPRLQDRCV